VHLYEKLLHELAQLQRLQKTLSPISEEGEVKTRELTNRLKENEMKQLGIQNKIVELQVKETELEETLRITVPQCEKLTQQEETGNNHSSSPRALHKRRKK
jgi:hypothetical protein